MIESSRRFGAAGSLAGVFAAVSKSPVTIIRARSPMCTRRRMVTFASLSLAASQPVVARSNETPGAAHPGRPARPARCEYVSADLGMSACTTSSTPGKSRPRAATSVGRTLHAPDRRFAGVASRG